MYIYIYIIIHKYICIHTYVYVSSIWFNIIQSGHQAPNCSRRRLYKPVRVAQRSFEVGFRTWQNPRTERRFLVWCSRMEPNCFTFTWSNVLLLLWSNQSRQGSGSLPIFPIHIPISWFWSCYGYNILQWYPPNNNKRPRLLTFGEAG